MYSEVIQSTNKMMSILRLAHLTAEQFQLNWLRLAHAGLVHRLFTLYCLHARRSLTELCPTVTHPHHRRGTVWRTGPAAHRTLSGSVWSPSNMYPARRRGRRTGVSTMAPRTMDTAERTGQVWVSCWIVLSATYILSAQAQGKMRNSDWFYPHNGATVLFEKRTKVTGGDDFANMRQRETVPKTILLRFCQYTQTCSTMPTTFTSRNKKHANSWSHIQHMFHCNLKAQTLQNWSLVKLLDGLNEPQQLTTVSCINRLKTKMDFVHVILRFHIHLYWFWKTSCPVKET